MSLVPSQWRPGRGGGHYSPIPEDEKCSACDGGGESLSKHSFLEGWSHVSCSECGGTGRKQNDMNNITP